MVPHSSTLFLPMTLIISKENLGTLMKAEPPKYKIDHILHPSLKEDRGGGGEIELGWKMYSIYIIYYTPMFQALKKIKSYALKAKRKFKINLKVNYCTRCG